LLVVGDEQPVDEVLKERTKDRCGVRIAEDPFLDIAHASQDSAHAAREADGGVVRVGEPLSHRFRLTHRRLKVALDLDDGAGYPNPAVSEVGYCAQDHKGVRVHVHVDPPLFVLFRQRSGIPEAMVG